MRGTNVVGFSSVYVYIVNGELRGYERSSMKFFFVRLLYVAILLLLLLLEF